MSYVDGFVIPVPAGNREAYLASSRKMTSLLKRWIETLDAKWVLYDRAVDPALDCGDRRRIYTARYMLAVKGKERGKFEATVQEVGSGPVEALTQLLQDAHKRIDDEHPPHPVQPEQWFPADAPPR